MPDNLYGYSFNPQQSQQLSGQVNGTPGVATQALRVLSLRLPSILAGAPIAPAQLLQRQLGSGQPFGQTFAAPPVPSPAVPAPVGAPPAQPGLSIQQPSPFSAGNVPPALQALIGGALGGGQSTASGGSSAPGQPPAPAPPPNIVFNPPGSVQPGPSTTTGQTPTGPTPGVPGNNFGQDIQQAASAGNTLGRFGGGRGF